MNAIKKVKVKCELAMWDQEGISLLNLFGCKIAGL